MDKIEVIPGAVIQHGKSNNRIYLMKIKDELHIKNIIEELDLLAKKNLYTKIFAKIPEHVSNEFIENGYVIEAKVENYALFMAKYFDNKRKKNSNAQEIQNIIALAKNKVKSLPNNLNEQFKIIKCTPNQSKEIASVYKKVFKSYPFPIHDPKYIESTMNSHVDYFAVSQNNKILALSSAEKDIDTNSVEMTDFATLPEYCGNNFAYHLLSHMDTVLTQKGYKTAYTIARAKSPGMNIAFARCSYLYSGTLINNTNIAGKIENMNVWSKLL